MAIHDDVSQSRKHEVFGDFEEGAEVVLDIEKTDAGKYVVVAINSQN